MSKIIKCKTCGNNIASSAKSCPSCGAKNKKPFYKKIWFWILVVIIIGVIGGSKEDSSAQSDTPVKTDSLEVQNTVDTAQDVKVDNEVKDNYLLGEIAELKELNIQVTGVEYSSGSEYDKPKDGYEYAIVNLAIKNVSDSSQSYNVYNFSVQNTNGQIENQTFSTINSDTALGSGELAPGGIVSGSIIFEVPTNDNGLKVLFSDNIFSDKNIVFDLRNSVDTVETMTGDKISISDDLPKIGDPVDFKNMRVSVDNVKKSEGSEWDKPSDGNEYVIVTVTLENISSQIQDYNPFDFKLQNGNGTIQDKSLTLIDNDTAMTSGQLAAGGKFSATIAFEAPIGDGELGLIYEPNWLLGDRTMISLK